MDKCLFISKSAIKYNLNYYKENTHKEIIGVIKNNAYGHGVKEIISLIDDDVKMYAVSNYREALEVSRYTKRDILILDRIDNYRDVSEQMIVTIISLRHLKELIKLNLNLRVHLKINVGMKRKGVSDEEVEECLSLINSSKLSLEGIYTHYSSYKLTDLEKEFKIFKRVLDKVDTSSLLVHASSSVSSLVLNENVTNCVRLGVGMYGLKKLDRRMDDLKIVSELKCEVKNIYEIKNGDYFGYHDFYYGENGYVVVVNVGYGDGLFYKNKIRGYLDGIYINEIGTRNMDNMYFYSPFYLKDNSVIEIFGKHNLIDTFSVKYEIPVCEILALFNQNIKKEIID